MIVIGLQRLTLLHHFEQLVFEKPLTPDQAAEFVFEFGELLRPDRPALQECAVTILALTNRVDLAFELANVAIDVVDLDFDGYGRVFTADSLGLETFDFLLLGKRSASVGDPSELSIHPGEVRSLDCTCGSTFTLYNSCCKSDVGSAREGRLSKNCS